jgi:hypothetical protein
VFIQPYFAYEKAMHIHTDLWRVKGYIHCSTEVCRFRRKRRKAWIGCRRHVSGVLHFSRNHTTLSRQAIWTPNWCAIPWRVAWFIRTEQLTGM